MFIDKLTIEVIAGNGGEGCVSFRREKYVPRGGPDGGDGGAGGDVIVVAKDKLPFIMKIRNHGKYRADSGSAGGGSRKSGKSGKDCVLDVPPGTMVFDEETGALLADLVEPGQKIVVARGGGGGRGNTKFATPRNRVPQHAEPGAEGETRTITLDLALRADVALVGLPASGKTSLLAALTGATPGAGDYDFSTRNPRPGVCEVNPYARFTLLDMPALCQGASQGQGLGNRFLRHLRRPPIIALVLDAASEMPLPEQRQTLIDEISAVNPDYLEKKIITVISKCDAAKADADGIDPPVYIVSAKKKTGRDELINAIAQELGIL